MPNTVGGVIIDPQGQSVTVDITTAAGARPTVYTTVNGSSTTALPATFSAMTGFHFISEETYTVSVTISGVAARGFPETFVAGSGGVSILRPTLDATSVPIFAAAGYVAKASATQDIAAPSLLVEAELLGYRGIGYDSVNNRLFLLSDQTNSVLFSTTDVTLNSVTTRASFAAGTTIRHVWGTAAGTILALVTQSGGAHADIWRSTDNGSTFTVVNASIGTANLGGLSRNMAQAANGTILYNEYNLVPSTDTFKLWKSIDDGQTWTAVTTYVAPGFHVHCVLADPYVANRFWRGWGDNNSGCKIEYSDNDGTTWTAIGSGDQTWRTVDILFTVAEVFMANDSPTVDQAIQAYDRTTGLRRTVLADGENTMYFAVKDSTGAALWVTGSSPGSNVTPHSDEVAVWAFDTAASGGRVQQVAQAKMKPTSTRLDQYVYGPDASDRIFWSLANSGGTNRSSLVRTARIRRTEPRALNVPLPDRDAASAPIVIEVGPQLAAMQEGGVARTIPLTNGREYLVKFKCPPGWALPAQSITLRNGSAVAGNLSVGIRDCDTSGNPAAMLGASASTAQAGTDSDQKFTLANRAVMVPGREYWLSVVGNNASGLIVGGTNSGVGKAWGQGTTCKIVASGSTIPAPTAAPTATTSSFTVCALIATI